MQLHGGRAGERLLRGQAAGRLVGTPIYLYTVWPTFAGTGSLVSTLYYLTLLLGLWVEEWVPRSLASASRPPSRRSGRWRSSAGSAWAGESSSVGRSLSFR